MGGGKGFTPELVIGKLGEAAVPPSEGLSGAAVCGTIGVTDVIYFRRRKLYGVMQVSEAERMKELEKENAQPKKLAAELSIDNQILKEATKGTF